MDSDRCIAAGHAGTESPNAIAHWAPLVIPLASTLLGVTGFIWMEVLGRL